MDDKDKVSPSAPITNLAEHLVATVMEEMERELYPTQACAQRIVKRLLEEIST